MSFAIVSEVRDLGGLASPPKAILLALALRADETRHCWPSLRTVAADAGYGLSATKCALRKLEELGLIGRTRRLGGGSPESTIYSICTDLSSLVAGRLAAATRPPAVTRPPTLAATRPSAGRVATVDRPPRGHEDPSEDPIEDPSLKIQAQQPTKRGTRLSPDWQPDDGLAAFARDEGVTDLDRVVDEFKDYWCAVPGRNGVKLDWAKTFRNRVRAIADRRKRGAGSFRAPVTARGKQPLVGKPDWMRLPSEQQEQQLEL